MFCPATPHVLGFAVLRVPLQPSGAAGYPSVMRATRKQQVCQVTCRGVLGHANVPISDGCIRGGALLLDAVLQLRYARSQQCATVMLTTRAFRLPSAQVNSTG